ncbi:Pyruvate/Phosphoenolpyruvate kinase-like domain-containing protein [Mycena epipterygia]|nr:Pyruvate/Phosphoenolpyruvate kinase-like domain-containing protein [Mycena epipterygia]
MSSTRPRFTLDSTAQAQYRSSTLQQSSNLQEIFKSGKIVIGISLSYPSVHVAKTIAATGADWCWIDAEHVAWSPQLLVECIQIIIHESAGKMVPVVRVPNKTAFDYMAWCLDAGAGGIVIPHMETKDELKAIVSACRFSPVGHRSFPPFTFIPGVTDVTPEGESMFSVTNKHVAIIPQIESRLGIQNLEELAKMDEISAFMIGVGDLRLDMGLPLQMNGEEPEFVAALQKAKNISKESNIPLLGITDGPETLKKRIDQGFSIFMCCVDLHALAFGMIKTVGESKEIAEECMQRIHSA